MKSNKGITLASLVMSIIILFLLSSLTLRIGTSAYEMSRVQNYVSKLKVIQSKVDNIAEDANYDFSEFTKLTDITGTEDYEVFSSILANPQNYNIDTTVAWDSDEENYYYFTEEDLEQIGLKDQDMTVIIDFKTRNVISKTGVKKDSTMYYRQYDLSNYGDNLIN